MESPPAAKLRCSTRPAPPAPAATKSGRKCSSLSCAALGAVLRAAREIAEHGSFTFTDQAASFAEIDALFD